MVFQSKKKTEACVYIHSSYSIFDIIISLSVQQLVFVISRDTDWFLFSFACKNYSLCLVLLRSFLKSDKPLMFQQMPTCTSSFPLPGPLLIKFRSEEPDGATQPPSVQIKGFNMQSILCHWKNGMFMNMPFKLDEFCPQTRRPEKHPGVSSPNESVDFTHEHSVKATTAKPLKLSHVKLVHLQSHSTHTFFAHLF